MSGSLSGAALSAAICSPRGRNKSPYFSAITYYCFRPIEEILRKPRPNGGGQTCLIPSVARRTCATEAYIRATMLCTVEMPQQNSSAARRNAIQDERSQSEPILYIMLRRSPCRSHLRDVSILRILVYAGRSLYCGNVASVLLRLRSRAYAHGQACILHGKPLFFFIFPIFLSP